MNNIPANNISVAETKGAGGVVFRADGLILLLRHREGTWVFPKGHIDPGENALEAALREVEEEAGVGSFCPNPALTETTRYTNAHGVARVITWFLLRTEAAAPVLREVLFPEGDFFPFEVAREQLSFAEDRRLLDVMVTNFQASVRPRL